MNFRFGVRDASEDTDRMLFDCALERGLFEHFSDVAERRVPVFVRMSVTALVDDETQASQCVITVLADRQSNIGRQACCANRLEHAVAQIRKRIEHSGNEHVAGDAANRVEVDMHFVTDRRAGAGWKTRLPVAVALSVVAPMQPRVRDAGPTSDIDCPSSRT